MSIETNPTTERPERESSTWAERQVDAARSEVADLASRTKAKAAHGLGRVQTSVQREVGAVARRQQAQVGLRVSALAEALHAAAATLHQRDEPWSGERIDTVAGLLDDASHYLDERTPEELADDVRSFAKSHPKTFYAALLAVGVALGRFLRSSRPEALDEGDEARAEIPASVGVRTAEIRTAEVRTAEVRTAERTPASSTDDVPSRPSTYGAPPPRESTYVHNWS